PPRRTFPPRRSSDLTAPITAWFVTSSAQLSTSLSREVSQPKCLAGADGSTTSGTAAAITAGRACSRISLLYSPSMMSWRSSAVWNWALTIPRNARELAVCKCDPTSSLGAADAYGALAHCRTSSSRLLRTPVKVVALGNGRCSVENTSHRSLEESGPTPEVGSTVRRSFDV